MRPVLSSLSRRSLLLAAAAGVLAPAAGVAAERLPRPPEPAPPPPRPDDRVAAGWRRDVLIRWGDRVEFDAPPFTPDAPSDKAAATQFGWDAVVLGAAPQPPAADGIPRFVLAVGHPTVAARMAFPGGQDHPLLAGLMQGASLVNLEWRAVAGGREGRWVVAQGGFQSRRLTSHTPCRLSGPEAASLVQTAGGQTVTGLLGVNSGCVTPWGTLLLAEGDPAPWFNRLAGTDPLYADRASEALFGWLAEVDPQNPEAVPVKRTALGRFVRGGVACGQTADGRAVVFMTDARRSGMLLRFVSAAPVVLLPGVGEPDVFDAGTLSVACPDGTGGLRFAPLPDAAASRVAPLEAASALGGQPFDGPAGLALIPAGALTPAGALVLACWGNPDRTAPDACNPRTHNVAGHILSLSPKGGDLAADSWGVEIVLLAGDPARNDGIYPEESDTWLSNPIAVAADTAGALWIATAQVGLRTGLYRAAPRTHALSAPYLAPRGAATGGVVAVGTTLVTAVRHPGSDDGASFAHPTTRWPTVAPGMPPQTTVVSLLPQG